MSAYDDFLRDAAEPPTFTGEDRERGWLARLSAPAMDTPLWLALLTVCGAVGSIGAAISNILRDGADYRLAAFVVTVPFIVRYCRRVIMVLRHRR